MNESYPSHRAPQQNPMKHFLLHRVALMHPMSHGRVNGVSMGPRNSSLRPVLVAVGSPFLLHLLPIALLPVRIYMLALLFLLFLLLLLLRSDPLHPFVTQLGLPTFLKTSGGSKKVWGPEFRPVFPNLQSKRIMLSGAGKPG